jgi:hypothetical protein
MAGGSVRPRYDFRITARIFIFDQLNPNGVTGWDQQRPIEIKRNFLLRGFAMHMEQADSKL